VYQIDLLDDRLTDDDLMDLQNLRDAETVNVNSSRVSDDGMTWLAGFKSIKNLSLPGHVGDEGIRRLSKLKTIKSLNLEYNVAITDAAGVAVARMNDLEELFLASADASNASIGDGFVSHLRNLHSLRRLDLFGTNVSDAGLSELRTCRSLEFVDLTWTLVSEAGVEELRRALPKARVRWEARPWDE